MLKDRIVPKLLKEFNVSHTYELMKNKEFINFVKDVDKANDNKTKQIYFTDNKLNLITEDSVYSFAYINNTLEAVTASVTHSFNY